MQDNSRDSLRSILSFPSDPRQNAQRITDALLARRIKSGERCEGWLPEEEILRLGAHRPAIDWLVQTAENEREQKYWFWRGCYARLWWVRLAPAEYYARLGRAYAPHSTGRLAAWAGSERAILSIVFTDIVGSTAIAQSLGNERTARLKRLHFDAARSLTERCGGYFIKSLGDGVLAVFRSAADAVDFATALGAAPGAEGLETRAGIHVGEVEIHSNDALGTAVDLARRVADEAGPREVWVSERAKTNIEEAGKTDHKWLEWVAHDGRVLKGLARPQTLWSVKRGPRAVAFGPGADRS